MREHEVDVAALARTPQNLPPPSKRGMDRIGPHTLLPSAWRGP